MKRIESLALARKHNVMGKRKDMKEKYCPHLFVEMADPLGELFGIGDGG